MERILFFLILRMQLAYLIVRFESIQIDNSRNQNLMLFFLLFFSLVYKSYFSCFRLSMVKALTHKNTLARIFF